MKWVLLITSSYFPSEEACEQAKTLTVPGEMVTYQCIQVTPQWVNSPAPIEAPIPKPNPRRKR